MYWTFFYAFFLRLHKNAFGCWQQKIDFRLTYFTCWLVSGSGFQLQFVGTVALLISQLALSPCGVPPHVDFPLGCKVTVLCSHPWRPRITSHNCASKIWSFYLIRFLSDQILFDQITVRSQKKVINLIGLAHMCPPPSPRADDRVGCLNCRLLFRERVVFSEAGALGDSLSPGNICFWCKFQWWFN